MNFVIYSCYFSLSLSLYLNLICPPTSTPLSLSLPPHLCLSPVNLDLPCGQARAGWMGLCTQLSLPPFCLSWHNSLMSERQTLRNCFCPSCRASLGTFPQFLQITHRDSPSLLQWNTLWNSLSEIRGYKIRSTRNRSFRRVTITLSVTLIKTNYWGGILVDRICVLYLTPCGGFHRQFLKQYHGNYR